MRFNRGSARPTPPSRTRPQVFAVGGLAYVAQSADGPSRVTLTDDPGKTALGSVVDGTAVAILGWRPGGEATRYRVRVRDTEVEGWLGVANLRRTQVATTPPRAHDPTPVLPPSSLAPSPVAARGSGSDVADPPRPFGQRR